MQMNADNGEGAGNRRDAEGAEKGNGACATWLTSWQVGAQQAAPLPWLRAQVSDGSSARRDRGYKVPVSSAADAVLDYGVYWGEDAQVAVDGAD